MLCMEAHGIKAKAIRLDGRLKPLPMHAAIACIMHDFALSDQVRALLIMRMLDELEHGARAMARHTKV